MKPRRQRREISEAFIVALGPPRLAVQRAELTKCVAILDDEESSQLLIAAVRRPYGGFDNQVQVADRDWIGPEPPDRTHVNMASPNGIDSLLWSIDVKSVTDAVGRGRLRGKQMP
jgi:hypothetical protein